MTKEITISYAYPSSTDAVRFGLRKLGCWIVKTPTEECAFIEKEQAFDYASKLNLQFSRWSFRD